MAWITVSDVEAYTGASYDSAESAVMSDIIDAVCAWIECYCDNKFTNDVYSERVSIIDYAFTIQNNLQYVYGVSYGVKNAIDVTPANNFSSITISQNGDTLSLVSNFSKTDIDISAKKISEAVTLITAESGWTATIDSQINDDYAKMLYAGNYRSNPNDSNLIKLPCANEHADFSQIAKRVFQTNVECSEAIVIYQGGYATVPADLKDATIRFTIKAYQDRTVTSASGVKKSEKIGDYAYTNLTATEEVGGGLASLAINYLDVLNCYKKLDI